MSQLAWRGLAVVVGAVVAWNLVALGLDRTAGSPGGPTSSSYATAPGGLAAYADLLERAGHPVTRLREAPAEAGLEPGATLVVLDPGNVSDDDLLALRRFVEVGGTLVLGGPSAASAARGLLEDPPGPPAGGIAEARLLAPVPEVAGVASVRSAGEASWAAAGEALPVLGSGSRTLAAVATPGEGRLVLLADASPLQNRLLDAADNAAFGLALAGPAGAPVVFVESVHGYGRASGLRAIPTSWRWALAGLLLAGLLFMLARGRRLGPPERETRALPPPRRDYVESLAATLAKTKGPAATAPLRAAARERLERRTHGEPPDLEGTARRLGLSEEEARAVLAPPAGGTDIMALGRALARLEAGPGATTRGESQ